MLTQKRESICADSQSLNANSLQETETVIVMLSFFSFSFFQVLSLQAAGHTNGPCQ